MKRRDFYIEYYNRTNRVFSDNIIWGKKEREAAWRKGQHLISKRERKIFIVLQYLILLFCWIPMCFNRELWFFIPIALLYFLLQSSITDFSILKIELLYSIFCKNSVYCSILHDIFIGSYTDFFNHLIRYTKNEVIAYVFVSGGKFYGKFRAVCKDKNKRIILKFKKNCIIVTVNKNKIVIKDSIPSREHIITKIATIINNK